MGTNSPRNERLLRWKCSRLLPANTWEVRGSPDWWYRLSGQNIWLFSTYSNEEEEEERFSGLLRAEVARVLESNRPRYQVPRVRRWS